MGKKAVWVEVRCDKHGTSTINKSNTSKVLKLLGGNRKDFGCPMCRYEGTNLTDRQGYHIKPLEIKNTDD